MLLFRTVRCDEIVQQATKARAAVAPGEKRKIWGKGRQTDGQSNGLGREQTSAAGAAPHK